MEEMSRAERASRSMSTDRVRASAYEAMGGEKGIVCVLPSVVMNVMAEREMSVMTAPRVERAERLQ